MRERWEYLILDWINNVENRPPTPAGRKKYAFSEDLHIWRPGAEEPEVRPLWSSADVSASALWSSKGENVPRHILEVFNELGAEGWELGADVVIDSVIGSKDKRAEVGTPIRQQRIFKRRVEA